MLMLLQQPPHCPSPGTEGPGLGSSPCQWVPGCRRGSVGSHEGWLSLHRGSSFLALPPPVWHGQECIPARALPAPRQSHCGGEDAVPAPQLVPINQHHADVSAGTAVGRGGKRQRNFLKALLPSPLSFACLLPQVKTNPTLPGQGRSGLVSAEVPMVFVIIGHPRH